jgi:hypothetical protein
LQLPREWVFLVQWQDLVTILLQLTKVWVVLVNPIPVQVDLVQLELVAHLVQVAQLVQQEPVVLVVQADLHLVQVAQPAVLQVVHRVEHQLSALQVVAQVLVVVVAVAAQQVLLVKVDLVTHLRQESRRE